ncbi:MAG: NAD-dependent epimerase/dehydratase family protein [Methylococcaceae bacterium]
MNTAKILVTDANGFIGHQVLQPLISQGFEVHAIANKKLPVSDTINWYKGDLLNPKHRHELISKIKPELLLHIAWYAEHGKFWYAPKNKAWLCASKDLFQQFARYGGKRIIGVGSCSEYDWRRTNNKHWQ